MAAFRAPNTPNTDPETPDEDSGLSEPARVGQNPPSIPSPLGPQQFLLAGASTGTEYGMMKESKKDHIERKKLKAERHEKRRLECVKKKGEKIRKKECLELSNISNRAGQEENRYMIRVCVAASAALCASLVAPTEPTTTQDLGARKPSEAGTVSTDATRAPSDTASDKSCEVVSATELLRVSLPVVGEVECLASTLCSLHSSCSHSRFRGFVFRAIVNCDPSAFGTPGSTGRDAKSGILSALVRHDFCTTTYAKNNDHLHSMFAWTLPGALDALLDKHERNVSVTALDPTDLLCQMRDNLGDDAFYTRCKATHDTDAVRVILDGRIEDHSIQLPTPLTQDQLPALLRPDTKK
jgi:hypothetical protein